jgi:aminoglycoside phosphotransferase (APT) family kinase protein
MTAESRPETPQAAQVGSLASRLSALLKRHYGAASVRIDGLRLLTGGASRQTWSFDAVLQRPDGEERLPLVVRMDPRQQAGLMSRETEFRLLSAAHSEGVPVPKALLMLDNSFDAPGFIMERVEGETIARRLLRDDEYAPARQAMTGQLARALAAIHRIDPRQHGLDSLPAPYPGKSAAETEVNRYEDTYRATAPDPHPALELAFRWLRRNLPPAAEPTLVHGDFRIGNIIFGPEGLRAVLDWELAHIGDPMEDLGWICVRSWRFSNDDLPVGGLSTREEFWRAYEQAGGRPVDAEAVRFWEVFGNLRWGVICINQANAYLDEATRRSLPAGAAMELAAIGRRTAETEWELLHLIEAQDPS